MSSHDLGGSVRGLRYYSIDSWLQEEHYSTSRNTKQNILYKMQKGMFREEKSSSTVLYA